MAGRKRKVQDDILEGLTQALAHARGEHVPGLRTRRVIVDPLPNFKAKTIKEIRLKAHLSQRALATVMGVNIKTVEAWEAGTNTPAGPAQRMLGFIANDQNFLSKYGVISEIED